MFVYCGYWHHWSRVLSEKEPHGGPFVEVNLTPIGGTTTYGGWEKEVIPIIIRRHGTMRDIHGDRVVDELPADVLAHMREHLSEDFVQRLLYEDFLSQVDWDKFRRNNNGGCPFAKCCKE